MKTYKKENLKHLLIFLLIITFTVLSGCHDLVLPNNPPDNPAENNSEAKNHSYQIIIPDNNSIIHDCTPPLKILTDNENISAMSFSGNGKNWSEWMIYKENYDQFNIASGFNGTTMNSGNKMIFARFKDDEGNIFPQDFQKPVFYAFEYEIPELFTIKIEPGQVQLKTGESQTFTVKGYDMFYKNEVPLDSFRVKWSKSCAVGELSSPTGLQTTYTAPGIMGVRDISASHGSLVTGVKIDVTK